MTEYQKYINALRKCAKEHATDRTFTGHIIVSDLCKDTANLLEELEQETILDKIRAEIEEKYGDYDICEWFEDYDWDENNISEYRSVGVVSNILAIIDKYKAESEVQE